MSGFLFQYQAVEPTTWVYLSALLMIGLFFKFGRFWSLRNLDLVLLILLAPGLLMVHYGQKEQAASAHPQIAENAEGVPVDRGDAAPVPLANTWLEENEKSALTAEKLEILGFIYLFGIGSLLLVRMLLDPIMVRRPLLEPNLSMGGLAFISCSLFVFLAANVISDPVEERLTDVKDYRIARVAAASTHGPGYELLSRLPTGWSKSFSVASQLAVVAGMVLVGYWHFRNVFMGLGAATLYLMLPYTSLLTGRIEHVLPAATLVWGVLSYRRPLVAGTLLGLASGLVYYPFFLLPLWLSFYWHRGFRRFLASYLTTLVALAFVLVLSPNELWPDLKRMFGLYPPAVADLGGIWNPGAGGFDENYRLPVLVAFIALSINMVIWPAQKNLGTLLSCSAAIMVATQFWHGYGGGTYMAWYLPLALLTIFRPNLEDRVAVTVLGDGWFPLKLSKLPRAA